MEEEYRFNGLAAYADRGRISARLRGFTFSFFTVKFVLFARSLQQKADGMTAWERQDWPT